MQPFFVWFFFNSYIINDFNNTAVKIKGSSNGAGPEGRGKHFLLY